jgi:LytS/YehU family sensor histidine kinase
VYGADLPGTINARVLALVQQLAAARQADSILVGLSEILRYSLEGALREKVPLAEELAMIERYIGIVAVQLEARLRFSLDVPAHLHACLVPSLMLQMLIENAIKHGVAALREGGDVSVTVAEHGRELRLVVANDKPRAAGTNAGLGLAINNIEQRLQLLYGGAARHDTQVSELRHTVMLTIPRQAA